MNSTKFFKCKRASLMYGVRTCINILFQLFIFVVFGIQYQITFNAHGIGISAERCDFLIWSKSKSESAHDKRLYISTICFRCWSVSKKFGWIRAHIRFNHLFCANFYQFHRFIPLFCSRQNQIRFAGMKNNETGMSCWACTDVDVDFAK